LVQIAVLHHPSVSLSTVDLALCRAKNYRNLRSELQRIEKRSETDAEIRIHFFLPNHPPSLVDKPQAVKLRYLLDWREFGDEKGTSASFPVLDSCFQRRIAYPKSIHVEDSDPIFVKTLVISFSFKKRTQPIKLEGNKNCHRALPDFD
jgi:hypothetical protein